jgi:hypothetical protein
MNTKRIAKELNVSEEELEIQSTPFTEWDFIPWMDSHYGSLGQDETSRLVFILTTDNVWHKIPSEFESECFHDHQGRHSGTGMTVAEFLSAKGISSDEIEAVVLSRVDYRDWQGQDEMDEREVLVYPSRPIDTKKIRRRVEDALRKTNDESVILSLAVRLGVKID